MTLGGIGNLFNDIDTFTILDSTFVNNTAENGGISYTYSRN